MGRGEGSAVAGRRDTAALPALSGYCRLPGPVPVVYPAGLERRAEGLGGLLSTGAGALSELLGAGRPELVALLVAEEDWREAPREDARPYPPGLPYFTRAASPPALVLPEELSPAFRPRTAATWPLAVWHELAHAYLLREPLVRTPVWMRELLPQALAAAVARRAGPPLEEHLSRVERDPGLTARGYGGRRGAEEQMAFQNLLLRLGAAALERFGEGWPGRLARALREEKGPVGEERAEALLAGALGPGGREWLGSRAEF